MLQLQRQRRRCSSVHCFCLCRPGSATPLLRLRNQSCFSSQSTHTNINILYWHLAFSIFHSFKFVFVSLVFLTITGEAVPSRRQQRWKWTIFWHYDSPCNRRISGTVPLTLYYIHVWFCVGNWEIAKKYVWTPKVLTIEFLLLDSKLLLQLFLSTHSLPQHITWPCHTRWLQILSNYSPSEIIER